MWQDMSLVTSQKISIFLKVVKIEKEFSKENFKDVENYEEEP